MKLKASPNESKVYAWIISGLVFFLMIALFSIAQLAITNSKILNKKEKIIIPMAFNSPFIISEETMSATYIQQIATSFLPMRLNVTPENVDRNHEFLLGWVQPAARPEMKVLLDKEAEQIKANAVSSSFTPSSFRVYPKELIVDISGELITWIGSSSPIAEPRVYRLELDAADGVLYLKSFAEVKKKK
ncbi:MULTISPECIES: type IV conjugative transfer system protein TraE [Citrobacter]|uniref:type IV conjugative transfer system protein TraE n=1 Tax=Citrobacter TaxID=544 RepID=UPI0015E98C3B|nr:MULTISPECIES: type IV conjugative transfer system protein TraE [Citrobacter]HBL7007497.1 type IV conjugative transfer system protein TraE [Citrobacter koseri]HEM7927774.1 type IV conjugative transfer system protein TraE [Citrobacter farmeri]MCK8148044.1 type IV conjugative transfer system protein TraE [Citrobacter sedlakii]QMD64635.1 type IV conjugative transfer system protein TraE [Citrobacter sp. RHB35-C17]HCJ6323651.1 type IV conjugative transfer system protein TraE [Citrobacter sedlakii